MGKRVLYILLVLLLVPLKSFGQTDGIDDSRISLGYPVYSQYLQNGLMINPAYAGSREALSAMISYRTQWMGIEGSPLLQSVSAHSPLKNDKVALGFKAQFMQYGVTKESSLYAVYAYHIRLARGKVSFGLGGGVDISNTTYSVLKGITVPDPVFVDNDRAYLLPNVSAGVYYFSKKLFAGISIPTFLSYNNTGSGEVELNHSINGYSFIATAGGLITFSDAVKFKPSALVEYSVMNKLDQLDINGNLILADMVWVGASWRSTEEVLVGLLQANITPQFMFGFSYDFPIGRMSSITKGSMEISVRYEFGSKVSASDPRYF